MLLLLLLHLELKLLLLHLFNLRAELVERLSELYVFL